MQARERDRKAGVLRYAIVTVPLILLAGWLSGRLAGSGPGNAWFDALSKPAIYPPPAAFGVVWPILYVLMGVSLAIVVSTRSGHLKWAAVIAFAVQLALNLAWSPLFFAAHQIGAALLLLLVLDIAVVVTIVLFWRIRRPAALLLLPYLGWILFATLLNWEFLRLNPTA